MIKFVTGDLLSSGARALVNPVNCDGYMGKGLAYQFKLKYPKMNEAYIEMCMQNKLLPGKLHCYDVDDKLIINFPTKNHWREKSKIRYIESGLNELVTFIKAEKLASIAIPPLGCGNGGLRWNTVRQMLINKLKPVCISTDIFIYQPTQYQPNISQPKQKLSFSALILIQIKLNLKRNRFNRICLQETAYFMNILSGVNYFYFKKGSSGPYNHSIDVISTDIKKFQENMNIKNTKDTYDILFKELISSQVQQKLDFYIPYIQKAASFTNYLSSMDDIKMAGMILYILQKKETIGIQEISQNVHKWLHNTISEDVTSEDITSDKLFEKSLYQVLNSLESYGFIQKINDSKIRYKLKHIRFDKNNMN